MAEVLRAESLTEIIKFEQFEQTLRAPGPWIAAIDFQFGQSRQFIENIGWPRSWPDYVAYAQALGRKSFCEVLKQYCESRPYGDKEHKRKTDQMAGSLSPQKLYGVPVGLMFFEGAPRLLAAGVTIPHLLVGDLLRVVVEAYPGVLARRLLGSRHSYKSDTRKKQTEVQRELRRAMLAKLTNGDLTDGLGFKVNASTELADDPSGDQLDALLCAVQAAWAWYQKGAGYGAPKIVDPLEGWISDPSLTTSTI